MNITDPRTCQEYAVSRETARGDRTECTLTGVWDAAHTSRVKTASFLALTNVTTVCCLRTKLKSKTSDLINYLCTGDF